MAAWRSQGSSTIIDHHHDHHDHHHLVAACDHLHTPPPADLAGPGGWRRGLAAIVAVGLRPCSGAILVLIFALAQGIFWAGDWCDPFDRRSAPPSPWQ